MQIFALMSYSLDFDTSVDEEIRKHYDPSKLENETLPQPPKIKSSPVVNDSSNSPAVPKTPPVTSPSKPQLGIKKLPNDYKFDKSTAIRIKKGTKFTVKSNTAISDASRTGSSMSFSSLKTVNQRYVTVPAGTLFKAVVSDSHLPQFSGNGGLIEININEICLNGRTYPAEAKITKVNRKKIFVNNIKGKRQYWKGVSKQVGKGENFYKKSRRVSSKLADNPIGIIISPIPAVAGMAVYAVNLVGSPVLGLWSKGGRISIPAGTQFEIKLLNDVYLY